MAGQRGHLCSQCGAVVQNLDLGGGERGRISCPECGLTSSVLTLAVSADPTDGDRALAVALGRDHRERIRSSIERCAFPFFGLTGWRGRRTVGGSGESNGVVSDITLDHGDIGAGDKPFLRVSSTRRVFDGLEEGALMVSRYGVVRKLTGALFDLTGVHTPALQSAYSDNSLSQWDAIPLTIDSTALVAHGLQAGAGAIAIATHRGVVIGLLGCLVDVSGLALAEVTDATPYLADDQKS